MQVTIDATATPTGWDVTLTRDADGAKLSHADVQDGELPALVGEAAAAWLTDERDA
jgi:hypothetical protein